MVSMMESSGGSSSQYGKIYCLLSDELLYYISISTGFQPVFYFIPQKIVM